MICFDSELFPQNFVWQLNNDRKSLKPHRNCQIKSSKWLYFSFHMSQRINNIQFYSYESIFPTNFKCSKHFALKKSSELWHSSSSRKGRLRIAAFQYYNSKDYGNRWTAFLDFFENRENRKSNIPRYTNSNTNSSPSEFLTTTMKNSQDSSKWSHIYTDHKKSIDFCIRSL